MSLVVRPRVEADLDRLAAMAVDVQTLDGYPGRRPLDLRAFLASNVALAAWVAELDGALAGHVALHPTSLPVVMELASSSVGCPIDELGVVARLIVSPSARRAGVGRALLAAAADDARRRGLHPILDVVTAYAAANALYDACGWRNAGEVTMRFSDGLELQSYVYVAPA